MRITGTIKNVFMSADPNGLQRSFKANDGKQYFVYNAIVCRKSDNGVEDVFLCEVFRETANELPYAEFIGKDTPLSMTIYFNVREYNGRYFQSIKLTNVMQQVL